MTRAYVEGYLLRMNTPLRQLVLAAALTAACSGQVARSTPEPTPPGCPVARPQSEIDAQGRLPLEPRDHALKCVYLAESGSRAYLLVDGRQMTVFQREGGLPSKAGAKAADESGMRTIASQPWDWARYEGTVVLRTTMPNSLYVEFAMQNAGNTSSVVDELARIASTLRP